MVWNFIIQAAIAIASAAYTRRRQKKMQAKADAEAEKRKGFDVVVDGEPINLPLVYGTQKVGGVRATIHTADGGEIPFLTDGFDEFQKDLDVGVYTGEKKEYMIVQQAICFGGIDSVIDIEVDGKNWDAEDFTHNIRYSLNGGVAEEGAVLFLVPNASTNLFTNQAWANMVFKLNRDDPNYNGAPDVAFFVKGTRVRDIVFDIVTGTYSFAEEYIYSNNAALVLADYLTRPSNRGGVGLDDSQIEIASFGRAKAICDTVVAEDAEVRGRVNGLRPVGEDEAEPEPTTRDVRLYEANITLDSGATRRDNIEKLLETMAQSELVYSEGQYKLILDYPNDLAEQDALVVAAYSDDDVIGKIEVAFAGASDKYNRATVKFANESLDFKNDSVSWPVKGSAAHVQYLAEDNNIESETRPC